MALKVKCREGYFPKIVPVSKCDRLIHEQAWLTSNPSFYCNGGLFENVLRGIRQHFNGLYTESKESKT